MLQFFRFVFLGENPSRQADTRRAEDATDSSECSPSFVVPTNSSMRVWIALTVSFGAACAGQSPPAAPRPVLAVSPSIKSEPPSASEPAPVPRDSETAGPGEILIDQSSPKAALASFLRAYSAKRYDLLVRFIPEKDAHGL